MKYYKLVLDNTIIGAITSDDFMRFSPVSQSFVTANELTGEYVEYNGILYRSPWMRPIVEQRSYTEILIIEITEEEYQIYMAAIENNEVIYDDIPYQPDQPVDPSVDPIDEASINFIRASKINEMSNACRQAIEAGIDLNIRGETHHFALTTQDQLNLMSLNILAQTEDLIPYHADGETCVFYTADEIKQIVTATTAHKTYHTTYYNALKNYINSLETIEEIAAITYGTPIPDEYKSEVLKVIEQ